MSFIYLFDDPKSPRTKALLGGKGANLAEMLSLGLPVPPGFTCFYRRVSFFLPK